MHDSSCKWHWISWKAVLSKVVFKRCFHIVMSFFFLLAFTAKISDSKKENKQRERWMGWGPKKPGARYQKCSPSGVTQNTHNSSSTSRQGVKYSASLDTLSPRFLLGNAHISSLCLACIRPLGERQVFRINYFVCTNSLGAEIHFYHL